MRWLSRRLSEPSTWTAAGAIAGVAGEQLMAGSGWMGVGLAVFGLVMSEKGVR